MLKKYVRRESVSAVVNTTVTTTVAEDVSESPQLLAFSAVAVGAVVRDSALPDDYVTHVRIHSAPKPQGESYKDVKYDERLSPIQRTELESVFSDFQDVLTDKPGCSLVEHSIRLTDDKPIQKRQYPIPFAAAETVEQEVNNMLDVEVIEPSSSPYASPFVLVSKKDGSARFCIDFRQLNKITVLDAEPIPDIEEIFTKLDGFNYFTKIDLAKGYWQVPVMPSDRPKTAFRTYKGLFQFTRMPFGLVTAPSTFARLMRKLHLDDLGAMS
ncbi:hypothetical protein ACOMHN_049406 [Nucella lapillus]